MNHSRSQLILGALIVVVGLAAAPRATAPALDAAQPYSPQKSNPVTYDIDFRAVVTAPYKTKALKVWVPVPPSDAAQELLSSQFSTFPIKVEPRIATEPVYGNRFAYFEFKDPQGAQIIQHQLKIRVWELHWNIDADAVNGVEAWPDSFAPYLRRDETQAVVVNESIKSLADEIASAPDGRARNFDRVLAWVNANMAYDHNQCSRAASSEFALENRRGHCSDYHGLCASLGRALGYPTRVTYGINAFPKNSPTHCKVEAYLPPYGWVSFDASETQKLNAQIMGDGALNDAKKQQLVEASNRRLVRGFRDNTWYLHTRGTDYDLAPPAGRRVAVVRTIYAEADGVQLPDPDPANTKQREFGWMTAHEYKPDHPVTYPFKDAATLETEVR